MVTWVNPGDEHGGPKLIMLHKWRITGVTGVPLHGRPVRRPRLRRGGHGSVAKDVLSNNGHEVLSS